jgi:hypothetical protein
VPELQQETWIFHVFFWFYGAVFTAVPQYMGRKWKTCAGRESKKGSKDGIGRFESFGPAKSNDFELFQA